MRIPFQKAFSAAAVAVLVALPALAHAPKAPPVKVAMKSSTGEDVGSATLMQKKDGVEVKLKVTGIPDGLHGVHVHAKGSCDAPDFKTAGGHFNPDGKKHGFANPEGHHAGDTEHNLQVDASRTGEETFLLKGTTLDPNGGAMSLTANGGTSIIIHEHADDMHTDPSGNSGNRIACGVIAP